MKPIRVLLIDDEPDFLETIGSWMRLKGYSVVTAPDGASGIKKVKDNKADIVFVDFKMPGLNGVETIEQIRQFNSEIPIVLVSAHSQDAVYSQTKQLGLAGFFSKVGAFKDLEAVLDVVLRHFDGRRNLE